MKRISNDFLLHNHFNDLRITRNRIFLSQKEGFVTVITLHMFSIISQYLNQCSKV